MMTDEQRKDLIHFADEWRKVAQRVGSLHIMWEAILDAENLIAGRRSMLPAEQLLAMGLPKETER